MGEDLGLPVPAGGRLLHIGPHKTGTTAVQGAFHRSRAATMAQGVRYAGPNRHPVGAAQAVVAVGASHATDAMGNASPRAAATPPRLRLWRRLVREIQNAPESRVVISSEWFADADDATIERIVGDLDGGERHPVHVVVTIRPFERILPSQWQQYAMAGFAQPYEAWLESVLRGEAPTSPSFWRRHRHDELVRRWSRVVGRDHLTVVVADDRDHDAVLRWFEQLAGLRAGTLQPEPAGLNRSLTVPEIEVVRAINAALTAAGISSEGRLALGLFGATAALRRRTPSVEEARLETPEWAVARARAIGREIVDGIRAAGVRVLGDLQGLAPSEPPRVDRSLSPATTRGDPPWAAIVGSALAGVATSAGLVRRWPNPGQRRELDASSSARLREVLASRMLELAARRPRTATTGTASPASLTGPHVAVVEALGRALRVDGVSDSAARPVLAAVRREFGAEGPTPTEGEQRWLTAAGAGAVGIARLGGLVPSTGLAMPPAPRRAVETLEVAGVSTAALLGILAWRGLRRLVPVPRAEHAS